MAEEINLGGGGAGFETTPQGGLINGRIGIRITSSWGGLPKMATEDKHFPISIRIGVYRLYTPKGRTSRNFIIRSDNTEPVYPWTTLVPINEQIVRFEHPYEGTSFDMEVNVPDNVAQLEGLEYSNKVLAGFYEQTFFAEPYFGKDNRPNQFYTHRKYHFSIRQLNVQDNYLVVESRITRSH
ncbi:hypothetical protein [Maribacter flavus]|uniref:Uncharacterized protein n=1 Tax=Maribacter flavus TaxID=1658664 RepID=A0A5B2TVX6_9FLAO|nr:hypothetical protein [Maribacter flavus]KAA2218542.1 hypothetical protein F0361_02660 [Maribacter flavus]